MLTSREVCIDSVAGGPRELVRGAGSTDGAIDIGWLGQAGFLVQTAGHVVLIDPYLSDSLAKKYRGQEFSYERLMPVPIGIAEIGRIDAVLCTHRHSDHMDPETLAAVTARHPACRFVVPAAELNHALAIGLPAERVPLEEALGRLVVEPVCPYPPGIPLLIPGERIDRERLEWLRCQRAQWPGQIADTVAVLAD